jgi:DNA-binding response OmpR family regulator
MQGLRLAVMAGDDWIRKKLPSDLGRAGFSVRDASGNDGAIALVRNWHPEIILLHIGGVESETLRFLSRVREVTQAPIIALLARDSLDLLIAAFSAGADDCLTEPFEFPELVARIRARLRRAVPAVDPVEYRS